MKIIVAIPYIAEDKQLALSNARKCRDLAGINCYVTTIEDTEKIGWVNMHNKMIESINFDYYCYSAADYEPEQDYLLLAINKLEETGKGLCGFNDGKWDGKIATAGVLTRDYYETYGLFHNGYHSHGADDEITQKALFHDEYVYEPYAVLKEMEYRKKKEFKNYGKDDTELYESRRRNGFT